MREQQYEKLKSKYNVNMSSIKSVKNFIHSLVDEYEDIDETLVSFTYSVLNESCRNFGNEILHEFEFILNENPDLTFVVFIKTVLNPSIDQKFKNSFYGKINNILSESLDNFTISNNKYFRDMTDEQCDTLTAVIREQFHSLLIEPLYSSSSSAVVYQLNGINIDELIYNEFIDFTLLRNNIYRSEFNIVFNKREFADLMDELDDDLLGPKNVFIHSNDIYGYLIDFEYDNGGIHDYVNFDNDEAYCLSFDDSRFQEMIAATIRKLLDRKIEDIGISGIKHDMLDIDSVNNSSIVIRGISKFIKDEISKFTDRFSDKFFSDIDVNTMLKADYEIMEYDSIQTAKQFLLTLMTIINIHTLVHLNAHGYKSRRFILRTVLYKLHLLSVKLVDYGTCIFEPKMEYKPFDWSDRDA